MSNLAERGEKVFTHYDKLLPELRTMVIDEMEPKDRCRFTRTSRQSNREARSSKNFLFGLKLGGSPNCIKIGIVHERSRMYYASFQLIFGVLDGKKVMKYLPSSSQNTWTVEMDESVDLMQFAFEHFKNLLKIYQRTIKFLDLSVEDFLETTMNFDFEIKKLNNLEIMFLDGNIDVSKIIPNLGRPLKRLDYTDREYHNPLAEYEQIYQIDVLISRHTKLNNEQVRRLTASECSINIGDFSPMDIFHFIRSWQRGEIRENFKSCRWNLYNSDFDVAKLFLKFGKDDGSSESSIRIPMDNDVWKSAQLWKHRSGEWEEIYFYV